METPERCAECSKLTIKIPGVSIQDFEETNACSLVMFLVEKHLLLACLHNSDFIERRGNTNNSP